MVTVTREQNPKPRERQATAARQLWCYPAKERVFLNVSNCLGKIGVCQNTQNSTSFPEKKMDLKSSAANLLEYSFQRGPKKPGILSQQTPTKAFISHFPVF